jgi:light-regulated signal transduction histidine kinase (bacteriophytochrome)
VRLDGRTLDTSTCIYPGSKYGVSGWCARGRRADTGLGLPISRALCEAMKLDLSVQSTLGRGSTFSIHFDVASAELAA